MNLEYENSQVYVFEHDDITFIISKKNVQELLLDSNILFNCVVGSFINYGGNTELFRKFSLYGTILMKYFDEDIYKETLGLS